VCLPHHQIVGFRPLELLSSGPPNSPVVHQTGTIHCPVRHLALLWLCAHCSTFNAFCRRPLAWNSRCSAGTPDSPVRHRTLSGATPDSPVNYIGAASRIPEGEQFGVGVPGAPDTVRWHTSADFSSQYLNPFSVFLLVCCEPLAPVELII
jgi:hypothetical protein